MTTLGDQEDDDDDDEGEGAVEIPLPNVKSPVLEKVIEYCTHYKQVEPSELRWILSLDVSDHPERILSSHSVEIYHV